MPYTPYCCSPCNASKNTRAFPFPRGTLAVKFHPLQWLYSQKVLWVTGIRPTNHPPPALLPGLPPKNSSISSACDRQEPHGQAVKSSTGGSLGQQTPQVGGQEVEEETSAFQCRDVPGAHPAALTSKSRKKRENCSSFVQQETLKLRMQETLGSILAMDRSNFIIRSGQTTAKVKLVFYSGIF